MNHWLFFTYSLILSLAHSLFLSLSPLLSLAHSHSLSHWAVIQQVGSRQSGLYLISKCSHSLSLFLSLAHSRSYLLARSFTCFPSGWAALSVSHFWESLLRVVFNRHLLFTHNRPHHPVFSTEFLLKSLVHSKFTCSLISLFSLTFNSSNWGNKAPTQYDKTSGLVVLHNVIGAFIILKYSVNNSC